MPYIAIKAYPKDKAVQQKVVERINQVFLEEWGCPQEAITVSLESVEPEHWNQVIEQDILPNAQHIFIENGQKNY